MESFTAGDPMREGILWTNLSRCEISERLTEMGTPCNRNTVRKLLKKNKFGYRKAQKNKPLGEHKDRNEQFLNIEKIKAEHIAAGHPVISIDTKKKELIGNFSRDGKTYTQQTVETLDHDFPSASQGKLIPHGIYDVVRNEGYINLNTSHDTSEFCCDSIAHWWRSIGCENYPNAVKLLILCDGGGSNSSRSHLFKAALIELAKQLGLEIRVAHYPPYCSKYNPIEHRMFAHVSHACRGIIFSSIDTAKRFMAKAKTKTGLKVTVDVLSGIYEIGKKCAADVIENMAIIHDEHLPQWNYRADGKTC